ncbi:glycoside hydrolase [Marinilabiliaceae bacterium JC017]|nr:glycoside hydrolase [Marinilabiliaceae bacterium JC017]
MRMTKEIKQRIITGMVCILCLFPSVSSRAQHYDEVKALSGLWRFTVGDDLAWRLPDYDDSQWDRLRVPGRWEGQGYDGYNGFAWYRKTFTLDHWAGRQLYLRIGGIDDADEVYINGKMIGHEGQMPPEPETAYDQERRYEIPAALINQSGTNVIAVRVYDFYFNGGITNGPVDICYNVIDRYLSVDLSGTWKFKLHDDKKWAAPGLDDSHWDAIQVPGTWEAQGWSYFDGKAWYRKHFNVPERLLNQPLVLVLGKVDNKDHTYLNGEMIGNYYELKKRSGFQRGKGDYQLFRFYSVPAGALSEKGNVLAVKVYDDFGDGGIYEGPVGIMTSEDFEQYKERYLTSESVFDFILDVLFD